MAPRIFYFTASDGYSFAVRIWDQAPAKGRIIMIHGIVSHGGWYLSSCRYLANKGFEVHSLDRRGSGLNLVARGDVPSHFSWLSDVEGYVLSLTSCVPTVIIGISWGGKLVAALARRNMLVLAGIVLICPGLYARQQANKLQEQLIQAASISGLSKMCINIPLQQPELFTNTPRWINFIRDDPLSLRKITVRFSLADLRLNDYARMSAKYIKIPTLLLLAGKDRIIDNAITRDFFQCISSRDKAEITYELSGHTLEFEIDPCCYLSDLSNWIAAVVTAWESNKYVSRPE